MNRWTQLSIEFANQRNYLDELFSVYPTIPEGIRDIDGDLWEQVEQSFQERDNTALLNALLELDLFPIKDSYVAYLKRDESAIGRNPNTVPLFRRWLNKGILGVQPIPLEDFLASDNNAVLDASDAQMMDFAREQLNYTRNKGLDFLARFNGKYVIGEAKFLTDFGGHQNAQFSDAIGVVKTEVNAVSVAILDGILYIRGRSKMHRAITQDLTQYNIMSALVLREFLYQL